MPFSQSLLESFNCRIDYLERFTAYCTDEVIMVFMAELMLIPHGAIAKIDFACKTGFAQQLQNPVYGCLADGPVALLDDIVQLFCGDMAFLLQKLVQDQFPLRRGSQPFPAQKLG